MTVLEVEIALEKLSYDMVVFEGSSFPQELHRFNPMYCIRYAKKDIKVFKNNFSQGWYITSYDYHQNEKAFSILFTTYDQLFNKKARLLNAIKDFV